MKRNAVLIKKSENGQKAIYVDKENAKELLAWINADNRNKKKFWYIANQILNGRPSRDLYDKENFEKGCENVTAIKPIKGKDNPRIYCQQYSDAETQVFVIVASELLPKKTSSKLSNKEKTIIRRVASYQYKLQDNGN